MPKKTRRNDTTRSRKVDGINSLMTSLKALAKDTVIPDYSRLSKDEALPKYKDWLKGFEKLPLVVFLNRASGYTSWVRGRILLAVRPMCKKGEWITFLRAVGVSQPSASNYMAIAQRWPRWQDVINRKQGDLLSEFQPSRAKGNQPANKTTQGNQDDQGMALREVSKKIATIEKNARALAADSKEIVDLDSNPPLNIDILKDQLLILEGVSRDVKRATLQIEKLLGALSKESDKKAA